MPYQTWVADHLRSWGLTVVEVDGWRTRGRYGFHPKAVLAHHTAGPAKGNIPSLPTLINGRPDVPGPLCNFGLARDGSVYCVAAGKGNHAGNGAHAGLLGSSEMWGIEGESVGTRDDWTPAQRVAYPLLCAALLDGINRDASWLIAHREWAPTRKIDPAYWDMDRMRGQVQTLLDQHDAIPPTTEEDEDMAKLIEVPNTLGSTDVYRVSGVRAIHVGTAGLADAKVQGDAVEKWKGSREGFIDAHDLAGQPLPR